MKVPERMDMTVKAPVLQFVAERAGVRRVRREIKVARKVIVVVSRMVVSWLDWGGCDGLWL